MYNIQNSHSSGVIEFPSIHMFRLEYILSYVYSNRKNIIIFIREGVNSIEYLFLKEEIYYGVVYNKKNKKEQILSDPRTNIGIRLHGNILVEG